MLRSTVLTCMHTCIRAYVLRTPLKSGFWILKPNENEKEVKSFLPRSSFFRFRFRVFQLPAKARHMLSHYSDLHTCIASQNTTSSLTSNLRSSKAYFLVVNTASSLAATLESKTKLSSPTSDELILFFE